MIDMAAKSRTFWGEESRPVRKVRGESMKCPWCGEWNDMTGIDWLICYLGRGRYSMSCLEPCLSCEREMYADLVFTGLKVKEEKE